jgi:hypothetical protein
MNELNQLELSAKLAVLTAVALVAFGTLDALRAHEHDYEERRSDRAEHLRSLFTVAG